MVFCVVLPCDCVCVSRLTGGFLSVVRMMGFSHFTAFGFRSWDQVILPVVVLGKTPVVDGIVLENENVCLWCTQHGLN